MEKEKEKGVLGFHQFSSVRNNPFVSCFNIPSSQPCFSSNDSWPSLMSPVLPSNATALGLSSSSFSYSMDVVQGFRSILDNGREEVDLGNKVNVEVMKRFCPTNFHSQPGFPSLIQPRDHLQYCNLADSFPKVLIANDKKSEHQDGRQMNSWIPTCCSEINASDKTSSTLKRKFVPHDHHGRMPWSLSPAYVSEISVNPTYSQQFIVNHQKSSSSWTDIDEKNLEKGGLVVVLQKELRKSDVSRIGRIVLPKKYAEANLPLLSEKDGILLSMRDFSFSALWTFKYRYWPNNKSRMYIMESTGDFIRMHELNTGDFFIIYRELTSGNLIVRGKKQDVATLTNSTVPV